MGGEGSSKQTKTMLFSSVSPSQAQFGLRGRCWEIAQRRPKAGPAPGHLFLQGSPWKVSVLFFTS